MNNHHKETSCSVAYPRLYVKMIFNYSCDPNKLNFDLKSKFDFPHV